MRRTFSTRRFNSMGLDKKEIINNFCPVGIIKLQSSAKKVSQAKLENGLWILTLDKLEDNNVTITMECGLHQMWTHTMSYEDARAVYNYYLEGWKLQ